MCSWRSDGNGSCDGDGDPADFGDDSDGHAADDDAANLDPAHCYEHSGLIELRSV